MSTMAFRPPRGRRAIHLSMTPLIDVLFLLIIFFVLTGTFRRFGKLELQLPDSATAAETRPDEETRQLELAVTEDGKLFLDEEPIARQDLPGELAARRAAREDLRVMLRAEAHVDHAEVVALLDMIRAAGFAGVGIGTRLTPGEPAAGNEASTD